MLPRLAGSICRSAAWLQRNVPVRFVPSTRSHSASERSTHEDRLATPALLTRTSKGPNCACTVSKSVETATSSVTSQRRATSRPTSFGFLPSSWCKRSPSFRRRPMIVTFAPSPTRRSAMADPRPVPPPVCQSACIASRNTGGAGPVD
jgi:hypothetical protein